LVARREDKLKELADQLTQYGVTVKVFPGDLESSESIDRTTKAIGDEFRSIHILVNCAGQIGDSVTAIEQETKKGEDVADMWQRVIQINLVGMMRFTNKTLPYMKDVKHGAIIAISSMAATHTGGKSSEYMASKHGKFNIKCNSKPFRSKRVLWMLIRRCT
jgi:short-subunit dehydrogenase